MTQVANTVSALNELPHGTVLMQPGWRSPTIIVKMGQRWRYVGLFGPVTTPQVVADAHPMGWTLLTATDQESVDAGRALIHRIMRSRTRLSEGSPGRDRRNRDHQKRDMDKKRKYDRERYHRIKKERQLRLLPELEEETA